MLSAFGIDHGEVSKGFRVVRLPKGPGGKTLSSAQFRTRGTNPDAPTRPQRVKNALNRVGDTPVTLKGVGRASGRAAGGLSSAIEAHPGLTGTALVGGGAAAGYSHLNRKNRKR